ncbi:DUF3560 domain-containing protein [Paraliomyxa miuraensis]|uniref:DUF3560 domain-containing protein n=1 Tax=Paraliomyxa miuraensis TaxID=376150 RepID=UPI002254457B|nr:DUF3560 domain-containing protein [Paraliomyxa miuraensis]MCX4244198.1 DUF3560 domain-containing protein [Paraliomyxa miuraensis]
MPETTTTDSTSEPSTSAAADARPAEVVVRYRYADGILLEGETYPHRNEVKKAYPRWRWFRSLRKWGVPRTRDRALSSYQVEEYARGLTKAGVPNVRVDYQEPRPEDVRDFGEVLEERSERALDRAERLEERADRLAAQAAAEYQKGRAVLDRIPMGQPILVGHHSEGRHRRDLSRADASMRRSVEASDGAKDARRRAQSAEHSVAKHEKPGFALRRVLELAKEARELEVKITGKTPSGWRGLTPDRPATGEWLARLQTAAEENRQKHAHYRRVLDEAGYMPTSQLVLRKGDRVLTNKGGATVQKPLSQLVELRFDRAVGMDGPRLKYVQRVAYDRVWAPKATVEARKVSPSTPAPGRISTAPASRDARAPSATATTPSPETSAAAPAGAEARVPSSLAAPPPSPTTTAAPSSPTTTAEQMLAKHADPDRYTGQQLTDALVEAERIGVGPQLVRHFRSKLRDEDVLLAHGQARGILAFERDAWPPTPLRGETYGKDDFRGVLLSLEHHPVIAELLAEARTWPERMKAITGGRHIRWFPKVVRDATSVVHDTRAHYAFEIARGETPTPALARAARDAGVARAKRQLQELREAQDPSLYDPKSDPKAVYPRLCKLDSTTARMVLEDVFGVEFHWEDKDEEADELCDGEITLETLAEGAAKRAEEERERKERERALREADARELLNVHREAASRGEVTKGRFNAAYWRLHPGLAKPARSRRALTVTNEGAKVEAMVRGPKDWGFSVSLRLGTDEQAAIEALMRRVEQEAGEEGTAEATAPAKPTTKGKRGAKVDVEALAKKHGIGTAALNGYEVHPALLAAERLGVGQEMAQLISKRNLRHPEQLKTDLGQARGVVALENDAWPPPPLRGSVYGKHDFEGIIRSLEQHPKVVELHREASTWADRMKEISADRDRHWFPKLVENARLVIWHNLEIPLWRIGRGEETPTPELAGKIRDRILGNAKERLENLRDALDPALYDPKSDPEVVYPRLCKIDFDSARQVMMDVFGLRFGERYEALELCRGETSIDEVKRRARARDEESERRAAARGVVREADGRDLLAVYRTAQELGEVGRKRFNLAYWRQHPELRPWERESRSLKIRDRHGKVEVTVRGPKESTFYTASETGTAEPEAIAAAMRDIEQEIGKQIVAEDAAEPTPPRMLEPKVAQPEDTTVADAAEEEPMADEKDTPRGDAAPGSLWTVEEEGFALTAPPGEGKRVQVPTDHQPALFDVGKPDPAVLERMRAEELAERRAKRPPADTSDPVLTKVVSEPSNASEGRAASPTPPPVASEDSEDQAPAATMMRIRPWVGEIQTVANRMGDEGRHGDDFVLISAVWKAVRDQPVLAGASIDAFKARLARANRDGLLRLHGADPKRAMDPELARESEIRDGNATFHVIEASPPIRPPAPAGRRHPFEPLRSTDRIPRGFIERQVRAVLTNRIADDGPNGVSEFSTKHEPRHVRAIKAMAKRGEVEILTAPRGYVRIMAGPKWGVTDEPKPKSKSKPNPAKAKSSSKSSTPAQETDRSPTKPGATTKRPYSRPDPSHVVRDGRVLCTTHDFEPLDAHREKCNACGYTRKRHYPDGEPDPEPEYRRPRPSHEVRGGRIYCTTHDYQTVDEHRESCVVCGASRSRQHPDDAPKPESTTPTQEIRNGQIVKFEHHESGMIKRFGIVVRHAPGQRTAEVMAPGFAPFGHEVAPTRKYHLHLLTNRVRAPRATDIGAKGLRLMKRTAMHWLDLRHSGRDARDEYDSLRAVGLMHRRQDVDLGGEDGSLPGAPLVVEPTELGRKVLESLDPREVNLITRLYVTPHREDMGRVFPVGDDLDGPDENVSFHVLEDTFMPTDESRGYSIGMVVAYDGYGNWRVLEGFTMGRLHDDPEWDDEHAYDDEWTARAGLKERHREHVQRIAREKHIAEEERIWGPEGRSWGFPPLGHEGADETQLDRRGGTLPEASRRAATERHGKSTTKGRSVTEAAGLTTNAPAANDRPASAKPAVTIAPIKLSPDLARRVRAEQAKLHTLPTHQDPSYRPVVVVAWKGRRRPDVFSRYHTEPLGALVTIDGHYDRAQIVAELEPRPPNGGTSPSSDGGPGSPGTEASRSSTNGGSSSDDTKASSPPPLDSFEEDLMRSLLDQGDDGIEPDNIDEARALEGMEGRGLVERTDEDRYRATPLARLEYVDVATGVPADPSEPGTLSTGRIVADIDGETVEVDEEDLIGHGTDPDPRKRRYRFDVESPADYPGQAQAKKAARAAEKTEGTKKGKGKKGKATLAAGLRATFDSPAKAAKIFYDHNEDYFDNVVDPWDGLRDWMDGIEVRVGRGHRKLSKTPAGQRILKEKHASRAIRGALAYLMGQAKGRRWETVPWAQVERLGEALERYFEAPRSGASQAGLYWRPFTGNVRAEDLDAMTPEQRVSIREQESVKEIGEQLEELKEAYERAKGCLPDDLRRVIERRTAEWSRWVEDPSKIPDYACEPDPETAGYLCNYPAVAGELRQLRKSCEDAYDPNWAAKESREGAPGFPDTSHGEDEEPTPRTASAKACCSRETPKENVCSAPVCQIAAGLMEEAGEGTAADTATSEAAKEPTTRAAPKPAKPSDDGAEPSAKAGKPSAKAGKPSAKPTKKTSTAKKGARSVAGKQAASKPSTATKPKPSRKLTAAERKKALAEHKKTAEQRRKQTAAERRAQRFQCSAAVAVKQAEAIDTTSYRRRVEDAAAAVRKAEEHVKHHERDLKTALREADAVMRNRKAIPMDREVARRKVREARCQLNVAQGTLRQRKRDHQRAQTELERALGRVKRREAVAAKRLEETKKAKAEAEALARDRK